MTETIETKLEMTEAQICALASISYFCGRVRELFEVAPRKAHFRTGKFDELYRKAEDASVPLLEPLAERSEQVRVKLSTFQQIYRIFATETSKK